MAGRTSTVLSSVSFQITLYLSAVYFLFYFLSTLCMIIYKSQVLSYPDGNLSLDLCLLFLMGALELLRLFWGILGRSMAPFMCDLYIPMANSPLALNTFAFQNGVKGNLQVSERCVGASLALTGSTSILCVYFLLWQSYVLRADVIISAILLAGYLLAFLLGFVTLARFTSAYT